MVAASISYKLIISTYNKNKMAGLVNLFSDDENGVIQVTKKISSKKNS